MSTQNTVPSNTTECVVLIVVTDTFQKKTTLHNGSLVLKELKQLWLL